MKLDRRVQERPDTGMEKRRNICFVINSTFPAYSGGRETWLYNVTKRLNEKGYDVSVVSYAPSGQPLHFMDISPAIHIIRCRNLRSIPFLKRFVRSYLVVLDMFFGAFVMYRRIKQEFKISNNATVFIGMDTIITPLVLWGLKRNWNNLSYIISVRGPHADVLSARFSILKTLFRFLEGKALSLAPMIWANGKDTQSWLKEMGFSSSFVPNGVDIAGMTDDCQLPSEGIFQSDNFKIVNVATLMPYKGIRELIEAGSILVNRGIDDFDLIFVGKGDSGPYESYASELGIGEHVHFLGVRRNVIPYLKAAHIATCLSGGSGMSMSMLECLASGAPVIAWDSPVYRQLITHKRTGYLVEYKNAQALAEGILEIKTNYLQYQRMGENAVKAVEKYDWENITNRVMQLVGGL